MMVFRVNKYLDTRISLLARGITSPELLEQLIDASDEGFVTLLHKLGIPDSTIEVVNNKREFERQLHSLFLNEITLLLRATQDPFRKIVIHWLRQYEVMNIKSLLRARAYNKKIDETDIELIDLGPYSNLSPETLRTGEDVSEVLRILERYGYSSMAQKARYNYEERQDVFELEAIIDRQYYNELMQHFEFMSAEQKKEIKPVLGMILDRVNLVWLLRYRVNYGMESSHVYYLLAPQGLGLGKSILMKMASLDSLEDMQEQLPRIWRNALSQANGLEAIENTVDQVLQDFFIKQFHKTGQSRARLLSYLWLRQRQLKQISIIIKGRDLALDEEIITEAAGLKAPGKAASNLTANTGSESVA